MEPCKALQLFVTKGRWSNLDRFLWKHFSKRLACPLAIRISGAHTVWSTNTKKCLAKNSLQAQQEGKPQFQPPQLSQDVVHRVTMYQIKSDQAIYHCHHNHYHHHHHHHRHHHQHRHHHHEWTLSSSPSSIESTPKAFQIRSVQNHLSSPKLQLDMGSRSPFYPPWSQHKRTAHQQQSSTQHFMPDLYDHVLIFFGYETSCQAVVITPAAHLPKTSVSACDSSMPVTFEGWTVKRTWSDREATVKRLWSDCEATGASVQICSNPFEIESSTGLNDRIA